MPDGESFFSGPTSADSGPEYLGSADGGPSMPYTYAHPSSSLSSIPANVRIPRYLRRYSLSPSASLHRPTSPLANSLVPDDYFGHHQSQEDVGSFCGHFTNTTHGFSSSNDHHHPNVPCALCHTRHPYSPIFSSGPKVFGHRQTTIPSPPASVIPTVISAAPVSDTGAHFQTFDACASDLAVVRAAVVESGVDPSSHSQFPSMGSTYSSSASVYSSEVSSICSFYTATGEDVDVLMTGDVPEINMDDQAIDYQDLRDSLPFPYILGEKTNLEEDNPWSWLGLTPPEPVQNDSSDSSGFAASSGSGWGFASRGCIPSSDTERESPIDNIQAAEKTACQDYGVEWPLAYLTSVREELQRENVPRREGRRFSWGGRSGRSRESKRRRKGTSTISLDALLETEQDNDRVSTKSRKLKKKRPDPTENPLQPVGFEKVNEQPLHDESSMVASVQGGQFQVDLSRDDSTAVVVPEKLAKPTNVADGQAVTVEPNGLRQVFEVEIDNRDERVPALEDQGHTSDSPGLEDDGVQITDEQDASFGDMLVERVLSRTPLEILQGLDVVHEVTEDEDEEEVTTQEGRRLQVGKTSRGEPGGGDQLSKGEEYPIISHKGKEKAVEHPQETIVESSRSQVFANTHQQDTIAEMNGQNIDGPVTLDDNPSFSTQVPKIKRGKLSKKRRSRRALQSSPIPTLGVGGQKFRPRTGARPSIPTLRPRRTPKTFLSSLRVNIFRSVALMLRIDTADGEKLNRQLRTPNTLVLGQHFTGKYIPRFPSRLDGLRSLDKKVATYE